MFQLGSIHGKLRSFCGRAIGHCVNQRVHTEVCLACMSRYDKEGLISEVKVRSRF